MPGHHHRAGSLKQSNKKNKRSNTSKRSLNRIAGGKIAANGSIGSKNNRQKGRHATYKNGSSLNNKSKRLLLAKQRRELQRKKILDAKRLISGGVLGDDPTLKQSSVYNRISTTVPKLIGVISLSAENNEQAQCWETQLERFLKAESINSKSKTKTINNHILEFKSHKKQSISILTNSSSFSKHYGSQHNNIIKKDAENNTNKDESNDMIMGALDLCRVCDVIIFTYNGDIVQDHLPGASSHRSTASVSSFGMSVQTRIQSTTTSATSNTITDLCDNLFISERGETILSACKAQGLPSVLSLLTHSTYHDSTKENNSQIQLNHREKAKLDKRKKDMKRYGQRLTDAEFGEDAKFMDVMLPSSSFEDHEGKIVGNTNCNDKNNDLDMETEIVHVNGINDALVNKNNASTSALIRFLCTSAASPPKWVSQMPRPYLVTSTTTEGNLNCAGHQYDSQTNQLKLSGFIRGNHPLCIYNLMHVPLLGTFSISNIDITTPPGVNDHNSLVSSMEDDKSDMMLKKKKSIVPTHSQTYQDSLDMFATPDVLEGEQNLIGFDDEDINDNADDDDAVDGENEEKIARPVGWSDYQSAWLDGVDTDQKEYEEDFGELAKALNSKNANNNNSNNNDDDDNDLAMDDDENGESIRKEALLRKRARRKEDLEFPDEVELKQDELARDRFARYRSLKSFRKSYWDPKENLPESYSRIYHFASFKHTQKDIMAEQNDIIEGLLKQCEKQQKQNNKSDLEMNESMVEEDDEEDGVDKDLLNGCVFPGSYVIITLANVPESAYRSQLSQHAPISAVSLLPHENKISVIHMEITSKMDCKTSSNSEDKQQGTSMTVDTDVTDEPIKSKDVVTFRCGWRTWQGRPVFSQNNLNADKHKLERFLPPRGAFLAASVFGPVCYSPCPVLCFSKIGKVAAVGSVLGADADRIVIKRIILTGFPTRVHKRHATVKYMFFNPEDVKVRNFI